MSATLLAGRYRLVRRLGAGAVEALPAPVRLARQAAGVMEKVEEVVRKGHHGA